MKGMEWHTEGYWDYVKNDLSNVGMFLTLLPSGYNEKHDWNFRTCTLEEFKDMDFDVLIASIWPNEFSMMRLRDKLKPKAKVIRWDGNPSETVFDDSCQNFVMTITPSDKYLISFSENIINKGRNWLFVNQEFDHINHYYYREPRVYNRINSYQNGLMYSGFYGFWVESKLLMPDFDFNMYGALSDSGVGFNTAKGLAESMSDATFIWQTKANEDGGGFLTHNAFAVGRPLIVKKKNYGGKMLDMLQDGVTCIDLDARDNMAENAEFIRRCSQPEFYNQMSKNMRETFEKYINYEEDAENMRVFLENLK